jgi:hypothetical protein
VSTVHRPRSSTVQLFLKFYYALAIMAAIIMATHMKMPDDLFGTPQGSPRTDKMIAASVQWAKRITARFDAVDGKVE